VHHEHGAGPAAVPVEQEYLGRCTVRRAGRPVQLGRGVASEDAARRDELVRRPGPHGEVEVGARRDVDIGVEPPVPRPVEDGPGDRPGAEGRGPPKRAVGTNLHAPTDDTASGAVPSSPERAVVPVDT
jgi:hypothetical protein